MVTPELFSTLSVCPYPAPRLFDLFDVTLTKRNMYNSLPSSTQHSLKRNAFWVGEPQWSHTAEECFMVW